MITESNINLVDWFDPNNKQHLEAYQHLCCKGIWPEDFIPKHIEIPNTWQVTLGQKIADCWIKHILG